MVDAEAVGVGYGLDQREGGGCGGGVDVEGRRAAGGEEAGFGCCQGEYVRYVGWRHGVLATLETTAGDIDAEAAGSAATMEAQSLPLSTVWRVRYCLD